MYMYRMRPLEYILGDFRELEKQQIYFAPYDEQNDPLEGVADTFWQGDLIVWKNFLCHYLLCLENKFTIATLSSNADEYANDKEIPIQITTGSLPERYQEIFKEIKNLFFLKNGVIALLDYLSSAKYPVRRNELSYHLKSINNLALHSIVSVHIKAGLYRDTNLLDFLHKDEDSIIKAVNELKQATDKEKINELFRYFNLAKEQLILLMHHKARTEPMDRKLFYLLLDFPKLYMSQIDELAYSKWYMACFMKSCTNASVWGDYGRGHTGICLKFKTYNRLGNICLPIERPVGFDSDGRIVKFADMYFDKVEYGNERVQVDFFRSILTLPTPVLYKEWYIDENGNKSICADVLDRIDIDMQERQKYWDRLKGIATSKTFDWKDEQEYRLILNSPMMDFTSKESRMLRYNFNDLEGVVFGMRTPIESKAEILDILDKKCVENNRYDLKLYQADYDYLKQEMVIDELKMIKFG